jgi:hypothetical protein
MNSFLSGEIESKGEGANVKPFFFCTLLQLYDFKGKFIIISSFVYKLTSGLDNNTSKLYE